MFQPVEVYTNSVDRQGVDVEVDIPARRQERDPAGPLRPKDATRSHPP